MASFSRTKTNQPLSLIYAWFSALITSDFSTMEQLLTEGLPVDTCHPLRHTTALMEATRLGRTAMIRWLLDRGASPAFLNGFPKGTALHCALRHRHWEIADLLLHSGANVISADGYGNTPLHAICMELHDSEDLMLAMDAVNMLVGRGCDVNALNNEGLSALHYSVLNNCPHLLELLLVHGAAPNTATPDEGATPLMLAALDQNSTLCSLLLQHGADIHQCNRAGVSAAHMFPDFARMADDHAIPLVHMDILHTVSGHDTRRLN